MSKYKNYRRQQNFDIPETMQALIASGKGFDNMAVTTVPVPEINDDQLLARVDAAGVCTSILKLVDQGPDHTFINGWDMEKNPVILGDEGAVTLVKVGKNLSDKYEIGQRFAIQPAVATDPINYRERYRDQARGMHKCAVGYTLGGNLAQYIRIQEEVLQAQCLLPLPDDNMSYFGVSMAEPISCIYSAQDRNYHIYKAGPHAPREPKLGFLPGGVAAVVGAGAMGRMHAELALRFSPGVLIVTDLQQERLDIIQKILGDKAKAKNTKLVTVTADKFNDAVMEVSNQRGLDDCILAVGVNPVQQNALSLLAEGGVANLFGGLPKGKHLLQMDALAVHYKEVKFVGSSGGDPSDMTATLDAIHQNDIDPGNYVAGVGSLDNAIDVLKMIKATQIDGKGILYPHINHLPLQATTYWDQQQEIELLDNYLPDDYDK